MNKEKNLLQANAKQRYLENIHNLVDLHDKNTQTYVTLAFTFLALIIFGLFAISPTFGTILNLQKQLEDRKYVDEQLSIKIVNLNQLQQKYAQLEPDLPLINAALPSQPISNYFLGELQSLVIANNITLSTLDASTISLDDNLPNITVPFTFTIDATGSYEDLYHFLSEVTHFDRITSISSVVFSRNIQNTGTTTTTTGTQRKLHIDGQAYYRK